MKSNNGRNVFSGFNDYFVENSVATLCVGNYEISENCISNKNTNKTLENINKNLDNIRYSLKSEDWSIDDVDCLRLKQNSIGRRAACDICLKRGHSRLECTRTSYVCILCGKEGHLSENCDDIICSICFLTNHSSKECPYTIKFIRECCQRCGQRGHFDEICPDLWRQYKYTIIPGCPSIQSCSSQNKTSAFCANCGDMGHYTEECTYSRMTSAFIGPPPIMEIIRFDEKDIYKQYNLSYSDRPSHAYNISKKSCDDIYSITTKKSMTGKLKDVIKHEVTIDNSVLESSLNHLKTEYDYGDKYNILNSSHSKNEKSLKPIYIKNARSLKPYLPIKKAKIL